MKYTAEMWDKMQHVMARYNDHMTHIHIRFNTVLNKDIVKKAIGIAIDKIPILKSVYRYNFFKAEWVEISDFNVDSVFNFVETKEEHWQASQQFFLDIIDERAEAQIRVLLLRSSGKDSLNLLINHMCMDGADLKELMYYISRVYTDLINGGSGDLFFKNGSRSMAQLYDSFSDEERQKVMSLVSYSKKQKSKIIYPFEDADKAQLSPKIISYTLGIDDFRQVKTNAKKLGVSVNDVVVGCFYRATAKMVDIQQDQTLGVPIMVNLRRYIDGGESGGACNLTSMVVTNLGKDLGQDIVETVKKVKENMDTLKDNYPGLHGLPLLINVFKYAPYGIARFLIGTFFKNPLIGVSNIGIVDEKKLVFGSASTMDVIMTGSVKYPPYMQLALVTFRDKVVHTVAQYGTENDHLMIERMFELYDMEMKEFINKFLE